MKRQLTVRRFAGYLLCLGAAFALVGGASYARFNAAVSGGGHAAVAAVAMETTASDLDLTAALAGLKPGGSKTVSFTVTNEKDGAVSDVAQDYTIEVLTTGNLPLTYTLTGTAPSAGALADAGSEANKWTGGALPAGTAATHAYTLKVQWPEGAKDAAYAQEIDAVSLHIQAVQAKPQAAS